MSRGIRNGDYVKVAWVDSASMDGWRRVEQGEDLALSDCITIGHLLNRKGGAVRIAGTTDDSSGLAIHLIVIPTVAVTSITRLIEAE